MNVDEQLSEKFKAAVKDFSLFDNIDTFVLLFSAGKDCTFLLNMLLEHFPDVASKMDTLCILYPHHVYCNASGDLSNFVEVKSYWKSRGVKIDYNNSPCADFDDDDIYGCKICKRSRKAIIDPYVNTKKDGTGLMTGFTLYDTLAYINMLLYHVDFNLENFEKLPPESKTFLVKTLHKIIPREILPSGKIMIRPLLRFNELEIKEYLLYKKIPYITTPCKVGKYKFKRQYFNALNVYQGSLASYDGLLDMLQRHKIFLDELPFDEMIEDNFFIDC